MSTRWYPLYQKGNPQLRIFLPNFWMKLIRPVEHQPPNHVNFIVSNEMSRYDVKNYLEKIYNVPVVDVKTEDKLGKTKAAEKGYIIKEDDYKFAKVVLPVGTEFTFPDIYPDVKEKAEEKEQKETMDALKTSFDRIKRRNKNRPDIPGWFTT